MCSNLDENSLGALLFLAHCIVACLDVDTVTPSTKARIFNHQPEYPLPYHKSHLHLAPGT